MLFNYVCCNPQAGTLLAGGWCGTIWAMMGDLDYMRDCLEQPNATGTSPCGLCPVDHKKLPWFDYRRRAVREWLSKVFSTAQWKAARNAKSAIFRLPGVTNHTLYPDWMHGKHLGTDKVFLLRYL